jgi:hypothetical protein
VKTKHDRCNLVIDLMMMQSFIVLLVCLIASCNAFVGPVVVVHRAAHKSSCALRMGEDATAAADERPAPETTGLDFRYLS